MTLNVLMVTQLYYEPPRQAIVAVELARGLSRQAKMVVISSQVEGAPAHAQDGEVKIYRFRPWLYFRSIPYVINPLLWLQIWRVARKEKADILLGIEAIFLSTFMAALAKHLLGIPFVVYILGQGTTFGHPLLDILPKLYDRTLARFAVRQADLVLCQTESLRERARQLGAAPDKIAILPNGIDPTRFRPGLEVGELRKQLGLGENTPLILFLGMLRRCKGVRYLIEASQSIFEAHPEAVIAITGTGPMEAELKAQAKETDPQRLIFLGFRTDIPLLLNLATVMVLPSLAEGFPQAILEAYACGVPVVATDVGGVKDILKDGENGFLIPPADPPAIARAVNRLLDDEALRRRMGALNRRTAVELYAADSVASRFLEMARALKNSVRSRGKS